MIVSNSYSLLDMDISEMKEGEVSFLLNRMWSGISINACSDPQGKAFLDHGGKIISTVKDKNGKIFGKVETIDFSCTDDAQYRYVIMNNVSKDCIDTTEKREYPRV